MDSLNNNGQHYLDLASLDSLRQQAQDDPNASLRQVALQFEGIFTSMLLASMREANMAFKDDSSPFHSSSTDFYQQMHDSQMSQQLSSQGSLGLADLIVSQLGGDENVKPASALAGAQASHGVFLPNAERQAQMKAELAKADPVELRVTPPITATPPSQSISPPLQAAANPEPVFSTPEDFVRELLPYAKQAGEKIGVDPLLLIAQSALETGWGQKMLKSDDGQSSFNLFNIKADKRWQGAQTGVTALEFEQELPVMRRSNFRVYDGIKSSFDDYIGFVQQPRYREALEAQDDESYIRSLHKAGYATDPHYADKILNVFQGLLKQSMGSGWSE